MLRTVFMGSPEFAVPFLRALAAHSNVVAVVCQPDRPAGRGLDLHPPAVKVAAAELHLPVLQPTKLKPENDPTFRDQLSALAPDLFVVVAYGRILPPAILAVPRHGAWNVHASKLPRYRGAAPVQWSLIRGDQRTAVTLMQMDPGLDTGPVLLDRDIDIAPDDTTGALLARMGGLGSELLIDGLTRLEAGALPPPRPQDHAQATLAPLLEKDHGRVDFHRSAREVSGQLRGTDPWPGAFTILSGLPTAKAEVLKLFAPKIIEGSGPPGAVLGCDRDGLRVACGDGAVAIAELQLPGRKRLPAAAAWSGLRLPAGTVLDLDPATGASRRNPLLS